jgi:hypothetical protein
MAFKGKSLLFRVSKILQCGETGRVFSFFGEFSPLGDKEKGLANPTKGFLRIQKRKSPYLEEKKVRSCQI